MTSISTWCRGATAHSAHRETAHCQSLRLAQVKEGSAEAALEKLQAFYSACKAIEQRMSQRKKRLQAKVPDIESTYNALLQMQQRVCAARLARPSWLRGSIEGENGRLCCRSRGVHVSPVSPDSTRQETPDGVRFDELSGACAASGRAR